MSPDRPEVRQVGNPETGELFCDVEFSREEEEEEEEEEPEVEEDVAVDVKELQGRSAGRLAEEARDEEGVEGVEGVEEEVEIFCFLY